MAMINLSEEEVGTLEQIAQEGAAPQTQRAQAVLLAGEGKAVSEVSISTQLTTRQVNYWLKQYAEHGLEIFPGTTVTPSKKAPRQPRLPKVDKPGVLPDDPMSEGGRKVMAYHLARLLEEEVNVRDEAHGEGIHARGWGRRQRRSPLAIFGPEQPRHVTKT